jgi:ATP-dependent RNA helicase RhlE
MTSVLVFVRTKHRADRLARQLQQWNIPATVIHGNRSQSQRIRALEGFREGEHRVLVATDIAARGIDVEGISHVVNFDVPHEAEVYVHRVGRTARAQRRGDAYTLVAPEEQDDFDNIEKLMGFPIPRARIPGFVYDAPPPPRPPETRGGYRRGGGRPRDGGGFSRASGRRPSYGHRSGSSRGSPQQSGRRTYRRW